MSNSQVQLEFRRIAEQVDVVLTEIYAKYVAQGSPTKLGGLRFLDVESAKTFAFEKSRAAEGSGNLLVLSAPFSENKEAIEAKLKEGPHANLLREVVVRTSPDAGKKNKYFFEAAYFIDTAKWLTDDAISAVIQKFECTGNQAVTRLLKEHVLPIAAEVMDYFVQIVREDEKRPEVASF
jgi:hypothetical protein